MKQTRWISTAISTTLTSLLFAGANGCGDGTVVLGGEGGGGQGGVAGMGAGGQGAGGQAGGQGGVAGMGGGGQAGGGQGGVAGMGGGGQAGGGQGGVAGMGGGGQGGGGQGGASGCAPADCPQPSNECQVAACTSGACSFEAKAQGAICAVGAGTCDGNGQCNLCEPGTKACDGNDVLVCGVSGTYGAPTTCGSATPYCDPAAPTCVECFQQAHCVVADMNPCVTTNCVTNACMTATEPNGTACVLDDDQGTCSLGQCRVCMNGAKRCDPANAPQTCVGGQWVTLAACTAGTPLCADGTCMSPWWLAGMVDPAKVVVAYQAVGASSLAASLINRANPGVLDAQIGIAPSFNAATGWTFNGVTNYLKTSVQPANNQTWSMIAKFSGVTDTQNRIMAGLGRPSGESRWFGLRASLDNRSYFNGGERLFTQPTSQGIMAVAGTSAYFNGVQEPGTVPASAGSFGALTVYIGAQYDGLDNAASIHFKGQIQALAIYNTPLTSMQVAAITSALQNL